MRQKTISNSFSVTPVYDGKNGDNGVDGYNTAVVPLYRRSATALTNSDRPNGTLTYSFTTNQLTGSGFNGWSQSIPAASAGTKLYVTMATARSKDFTDEISANEWSTPVEYVADGMNSATILIYKRSATQPNNSDRPANGVVYTFADGSLSGTLNGWSKTIPATDGNPCWVRQATAVSNTTTDTINSSEWSGDNSGNAIKLIEDGINSAVVPLYRRSATALTDSDRPTGKLTYTFSTGALSGSGFNSWSQSIPAASAGTKLYVIMATARGTTDTDEISANEWSTPVEYVADGMNSAPVVIYKRADSIESTDKPSDGSTYYFSTGVLSGTLNGWSTQIPNSNGKPCWVRHATAVSNTNTDTINASEWSSATKLVENGDVGYSIVLTLTRDNLYTEANWNTYAALGHSESYSKRTGDSDFTKCRVGDYFVVTGKASDSLLSHTAIYKCTSVSASSITGTCVSHTKDGNKGDDAVTYQIVFSEAWAKVDASNVITARLRGYAYKIVGNTRTAMSSATIRIGYILNNSDTYVEITTNSSGYFTEDNWFNGDTYGESGYSQGSQVIFAAIIINSAVKCVEYITMTLAGAKGDTGRMYYIAGEFPQKAPYTRTDKLCPIVYYATEWWYLDAASATGSDTPSDGSNKWKKIANFGVVLTDAIFVKNFAQFGSAIITGDWLISVHGMIGNTFYGGSVENPDEYQDRAAYTYFDPAYPWGYDPFQLPVTNEEIETNKLTSWTRITDNFKLPAGTYTFNITCYANSSDTLHLRLFYGDESADDLYLGSTGSDEAVTLTFTKTLTSKSNWNVRATMEASGEIGYILSVEVAPNDARFIPNYAVDLRTGRTYQSDANIKGSIQCIGPTSKVMIEDGVIRFFGSLSFPNIVLGVNEDGCAVLNFYDKNGNFKYGLGPDEIFRTKSQAESMTLKFYNVDAGSNDCTSLTNAEVVMLYLYMFKNQLTNDLVNRSLYKYLAKIASGVYGPGDYCASSADAQKYNEKIIKYGYSASAKLKDSDVYTFGGIVVTTGRTTSGIINKLSYMLNGETVDELDYRGYNVMQDSDFNKTKEGTTYYYRTKDTYNPVQAFYWDSSYPSSSPGGIGYESGYSDKYYLNLCTNPADDDTLIDPVYYFNLMLIDSNGNNKGFKTLYINRKKLSDILQAAGKSL